MKSDATKNRAHMNMAKVRNWERERSSSYRVIFRDFSARGTNRKHGWRLVSKWSKPSKDPQQMNKASDTDNIAAAVFDLNLTSPTGKDEGGERNRMLCSFSLYILPGRDLFFIV